MGTRLLRRPAGAAWLRLARATVSPSGAGPCPAPGLRHRPGGRRRPRWRCPRTPGPRSDESRRPPSLMSLKTCPDLLTPTSLLGVLNTSAEGADRPEGTPVTDTSNTSTGTQDQRPGHGTDRPEHAAHRHQDQQQQLAPSQDGSEATHNVVVRSLTSKLKAERRRRLDEVGLWRQPARGRARRAASPLLRALPQASAP